MGLNPSLTSAWDVLNVAQTFHHTPQVKILHGLALPRHSRARAPSSSPCKLFLSWCYDISQERASTHLPCWEEMLGPLFGALPACPVPNSILLCAIADYSLDMAFLPNGQWVHRFPFDER